VRSGDQLDAAWEANFSVRERPAKKKVRRKDEKRIRKGGKERGFAGDGDALSLKDVTLEEGDNGKARGFKESLRCLSVNEKKGRIFQREQLPFTSIRGEERRPKRRKREKVWSKKSAG